MDTPALLPALLTAGLLFWLYENPSSNSSTVVTATRSEDLTPLATNLRNDLSSLLDRYYQKYLYPHAYPVVHFVIPSHHSLTYNHEEVHLMLADPDTGEPFAYNTLLQVGAHECAHVLCQVKEDDDHGPAFTETLRRLDAIATEMKLYDATLPIPKRYRQLCET